MWARFDDFVRGAALRCPPPDRVLTADRPSDVVGVLAEGGPSTSAGGWAYGYLSYEAAAGLDPGLPVPAGEGDLPLAWFALCGEPEVVPLVAASARPERTAGPWVPDWDEAAHRAAVEAVRGHIAAGETYQVNLTTRLRSRVAGDPFDLYAGLATAQRGAYCAYLDTGRHAVASASPELFFELAGDRLLVRPMKGTAPRGRSLAEDAARADRLRADPKERAENVMIVDLVRNDAARIAATGSVRVPALFRVERYPTVLQMTSDVTARLRPGTGLVDVFRALFPCGSVTGAPKRRTMRLIVDLEDGPRGVYCGAVGLLAPPSARGVPRARFSVAIRTVVVDRATGSAVYGVGSGVTWSSDAAAEHRELRAKAAVLERRPEVVGLFETLGHHPGEGLRHLDRHLDRMASSAAHLDLPFDRAAAAAQLAAAVVGAGPARVRLRLAPDGTTAVDVAPLPAPSPGPVVLAVDDGADAEPVDPALPRWQHKTTARAPYERARARHRHADDVVLVNVRGEVTETTIASVAALVDGTWCTPPLPCGLLPGVERGRLLEQGLLVERVLTPDDLRRADGLAVLSSLRGWRAARLARRPATVVP